MAKPVPKAAMGSAGARFFVAGVTAAVGLAGVIAAAVPVRAQDCPGNPDALGTSRVIAIDPSEYPRVGTLNYPQTLPLEDHEVVLTFDDGPLPPHTTKVLDVLAAQCIKATFFLVGEMARAYPATVKRIYQDGHTIGTHSEDHPLRFGQLPIEKMRWEIDQGIVDVGAALGDPDKVAPFFRIPGFARSDLVEDELAARGLAVFSTDTVEDDWHRHITPAKIISLALERLEKRGKGILLLHDIHPWTAAALPGLLQQLKERGFRIVQVVPAVPSEPPMFIAGPAELTVSWSMARQDAIDNTFAALDWPPVNPSPAADQEALPVPPADIFAVAYPLPKALMVAAGDDEVPPSVAVDWPDVPLPGPETEAQLDVPSVLDIGWPVRAKRIIEPPAPALTLAEPPREEEHRAGRHHLVRHAHLRGHEGGHRHAHGPAASKEHADLAATLAALFTPAK